VAQRRDDGFQLTPLVEQLAGPPQRGLDIGGLCVVRGLLVDREAELAAPEAQHLEHDLVDGGLTQRPLRLGGDQRTIVDPHLAPPTVAVDV
jgi:hypothetical protein